MRAFIAIELPVIWQQAINDLQHHIKSRASIRWVKPSQVHLTLKFLENIQPQDVPLIQQQLHTITAGLNSFILETERLGAFPSLSQPQIIWLGLSQSPLLFELAHNIEQELTKLGFPPEDRGFKAHITIGRLTSKGDEALKTSLLNIPTPDLSYSVVAVKLIQSTLTPQGPIYQILSTHPLKAL